MIDVKKALSQRCYIIFDSNEQLVKFVRDNNLNAYVGLNKNDTVISVYGNDEYLTLNLSSIQPHYHHTELTITDDGE
jgi:hypothetical protein